MPEPVKSAAVIGASLSASAGVFAQYGAYVAPAIFGGGGALCAIAFVTMDPPLTAAQKISHILGSAFIAAAGTGLVMRISGWDGPEGQSVIAIVLGIGAPVIVRTVWDSIGTWVGRFADKRGK